MKKTGKIVNCEYCGKSMYRKRHRLEQYKHQFCSMPCKGKWKTQQLINSHPEDIMRELYINRKMSFRQIAKSRNMNERSVGNLLTHYEIPIRYGYHAIRSQWYQNGKRRSDQARRFIKCTRECRPPSPSEKKMMEILMELGIDFEFEYPIECYLLDFALVNLKINIEVDGKNHRLKKQQKIDCDKTEKLNSLGWRVIRYTNFEVQNHPMRIKENLRQMLSIMANN